MERNEFKLQELTVERLQDQYVELYKKLDSLSPLAGVNPKKTQYRHLVNNLFQIAQTYTGLAKQEAALSENYLKYINLAKKALDDLEFYYSLVSSLPDFLSQELVLENISEKTGVERILELKKVYGKK